jgi:hypothetical protein
MPRHRRGDTGTLGTNGQKGGQTYKLQTGTKGREQVGSAYDASLAAQYAVGSISLTASQITAADVSGNGSVSAADSSWISSKAVDSGVTFPVER